MNRRLLPVVPLALAAALAGVPAPARGQSPAGDCPEPIPAQATAGPAAEAFLLGELSSCLNEPAFPEGAPPAVPSDSILTEQPEVNCFAWQEFLALGWKASATAAGQPDASVTAASFGDPGSGPAVWETYQDVTQVFLPGGKLPPPWGARAALPSECGGSGLVMAAAGPGKLLEMTAKFNDQLGERQVLDEVNEAGVTPPAWLTAQTGRWVHYEVRINEDFFNYVVDPLNRFYDARYQAAAVQPGGQGIDLPNGPPSPYGSTGAMEIKAGWLEIDPSQADRYWTAEAILVDENADPPCRKALVGLVMIHVIHKTLSMPNWTWATFEHVDNAPDRVEVETGELHPPYTFYKPDCTPADAPECQPNRKPEYGDPMDRPIQVVREVPIPGYVKALNERVHATIRKANPKSVYLNYHLINTLWPQSGEGFLVGDVIPLLQGGPAPTTGLSNSAAETYAQTSTCLDCHQFAPIACSSASGPDPQQAADYTFQLSRASEPDPPAFCQPPPQPQSSHGSGGSR